MYKHEYSRMWQDYIADSKVIPLQDNNFDRVDL